VGAHKQFSESSRQLSHLISPVFTEYVNNDYEARRMFERFLAEGQEGTILKDRNAIWEDKRSKGSIKFKGELEADMRIIGWELGTGKNANRLGALVVSSEDGRIVVNVGTGFTDADRDSIQPSVVGKIASIKYNARIQDKKGNTESLFLPVFVEIREDKDVADHSTVMK
jgi:ATP-dependent DNA ligase